MSLVSLITLKLLGVVSLRSGNYEGKRTVYWFTKAESAFLRKYACWQYASLIYCSECERFECALVRSRRVPRKVCSFRKDAEFVRL
jgi:hypothetical protein